MAPTKLKRKKQGFSLRDETIEQPQGMVTSTQQSKGSNFNHPNHPIQHSSDISSRTQVGKRVYNGPVNCNQHQASIQPIHHHDRDCQTNSPCNEKPATIVNHRVENQTLNLQHEHSLSQDMNSHMIGTNNDREKGKRVRGPTYMKEIWGRPSHLPLIELGGDELGAPMGKDSHQFCEFLGSIARNGKYCPIDIESWPKMTFEYKNEMLCVIKARYDHLVDDDWILKSIASKWKGTESKKQISQIKENHESLNRKAPICPSSSQPRKRKGRKPSHAKTFGECFPRSNPTVSHYLDAIEEKRNLLLEGSTDPVGPNDLFAKVIGQDRLGQIRMFGTSASPLDVLGDVPNRSKSKRIIMENKKELAEQKKLIAELQSSIRPSSSLNDPSRQTLMDRPHQVGDAVIINSVLNPNEVVAKGYLLNFDPKTEVGGLPLGSCFCEVLINAAVQPTVELLRPYDFYQTIGDALGVMVAWPRSLVTPA